MTTNTTAIDPRVAGIAVACDGTFYGVGDTFSAARKQAIEFADGDDVPSEMPVSLCSAGWVAMPVTAALRRHIEAGGARDGYRLVDGTDFLADVRS